MASPAWWPTAAEVGLLDVRDGFCSVSFVDTASGKLVRYSEPAVLRASNGAFSHWGRKALAWKGRLPQNDVREVFPTGWPVETALARWYLKRFHATYLPARSACRVYLVETQERSWARQLWHETLEDSAFACQGFLAPWQHDLLVAKGGEPAQAMSPYVHFRLDDDQASWQLLSGGVVAGAGSHLGLSASRLLAQLGDFVRRRLFLEVSTLALENALSSLAGASLSARADKLVIAVAGRQAHSGLPSRQRFAFEDFVATRPSVLDGWREVRRRILAEAEDVAGVSAGRGEGLDLPGWRVLTSGPLAPLFVEGPAVRLMDHPA